MMRSRTVLVLVCAIGVAFPAMAEEKTCDSPSRYKNGLNVQVEARDKDIAYSWSFVGGLTKQEKLDDSEASNTSDDTIALKDSYRNVYVDRLIISTLNSNKNVETRVQFEGKSSSRTLRYTCSINWKTSKDGAIPGSRQNQMRYFDYSCTPAKGTPEMPIRCRRTYSASTNRFTVKLSLGEG